jgi:hypothetical protein
MAAKPPKFELKKSFASIESLYREGQVVPAALYDHINQLFDAPAYSKKFNRKRVVAHKLDQSLKKYLSTKKMDVTSNYFLFHKKRLKAADIKTFYNTVKKLLKKTTHVIYRLTALQFDTIKSLFDVYARNVGDQLVIYWHGNQTITGAPLVLGGHQHVEYFQWGNLYGIVKYQKLPGEEINTSNLLIYFENRRERNFKQCLDELLLRLQKNTQPQLAKISVQQAIKAQAKEIPAPAVAQSIAPRFVLGMVPPKDNEN